jgi:hypothetical protein
MTNEEILGFTVLNSWKLVISRFNKTLSERSDEQLQQQTAPGRNRVFYLLGHLTAMHDERAISESIGGRTVFDGKVPRQKPGQSRQLNWF